MTDILCRWMNEELRLSQVVEPKTFAKAFSSGYLFGEILHKYQLQNDFHMFMKKERSISMLNNFTRLEPTLQLLGIPFSATTAQEVMQERPGVASQIVYQLYTALERKRKANISGTVMTMMQSTATASLHRREHLIYCDRLHKEVKRDAQVNLQKISKHYQDKSQQVIRSAAAQKTSPPKQVEKSERNSDKVQVRPKQSELMPFKTSVRAPKTPPRLSQHLKKSQRKDKQAQDVQNEIAQFETNRRRLGSHTLSHPFSGDISLDGNGTLTEAPVLVSNSLYIQQIRQRLEEQTSAREQRDQRVQHFLIQQSMARHAERTAKEEEYLVKRLTRPTRQEQRVMSQLLQIHRQKEVIVKNREFREQQIQQRRERDHREGLEREAGLAEQGRLAREEEVKQELDFCKRLEADRAQSRLQKRSQACQEIVQQIVDMATKAAEYHQLTGKVAPEKQRAEWRELVLKGLPLYQSSESDPEICTDSIDHTETQKQHLLNNMDYDEYTNMRGEWVCADETGQIQLAPPNNDTLGHVIARLRTLLHPPPSTLPHSPYLPHCIRACVLGKLCAGKTSCLDKIAQAHGVYVLSAQTLVNEALTAYHNRETATEHKDTGKETREHSEDKPKEDADIKLSARALFGEAADKTMKEGNDLPPELVVDIITEAIKHIPANSGWILDGFPADITQARLLEKALGAPVGDMVAAKVGAEHGVTLALDPDPPKPPPPPPPALDLVLLLDITDTCAVTRAVHQANAKDSSPDYFYISQIPYRVSTFQETWPKLEEWFGLKQKILVRVDADVEEEELLNRVESVLHTVRRTTPEAPPPDDHVSTPSPSRPASNQESDANKPHATPDHSLNTEQDGSAKTQTNADNSKESSRNPSLATLATEGSSTYVDKPLPPGIPEALHSHWESVCQMYVTNVKSVMEELRLQRSIIHQHLFNIREDFKHYLGRPDLRQELVSQWQKDFNSVSDDMREDEETRAELHLRLDELSERLWSISDRRREENEKERTAVMEDGWIQEHCVIITNYHSILTQIELDRFRDTFCILKKYYQSMYNNPLPEPPSHLSTVHLLDPSAKDTLETHAQNEPSKSHKKLMDDYEEAMTGINSLLPVEPHQREPEIKQPSADRNSKKPPSAKKKKGAPSPPPPPTPAPVRPTEETSTEYTGAVKHEEKASKLRASAVKQHGFKMVDFLQSSAEQSFSSMKTWMEEYYDKEKKSIEQLSELIRDHIEAGAKLQNELVLDCTNFFINGDHLMIASPPPPPRLPPLEQSSLCFFTVFQLELLCLQFRCTAPSGILTSVEFYTLLKDLLSANRGRNTLPELWVRMTEMQLLEVVSELTDPSECVDWIRFLLSCVHPWTSPSTSQLLDLLHHYNRADTDHTGYISEDQYIQTGLWFPKDTEVIPEDPLEPLPYDRYSSLCKLFFQLFSDSSSPPRLYYRSMLLYLSADPNPKQGFIRALSVVLGQHLRHSTPSYLVRSLPSLDEAQELSSSPEPEEDSSPTSSSVLGEHSVTIPALILVLSHSRPNENSSLTYTELVGAYKDLGYGPADSVPFSVLSQHPFIQHLMESSTQHQLINIYKVLRSEEDQIL